MTVEKRFNGLQSKVDLTKKYVALLTEHLHAILDFLNTDARNNALLYGDRIFSFRGPG